MADSPVEVNQVPAVSATGNDTVQRALASYEIGRKLKQLRAKSKIGLVELGKQTGLSASMLSQLENGRMVPTLPTLARIGLVFDVGVDHFFADRQCNSLFSVVRAAERADRTAAADPANLFASLAFSNPDNSLQAYAAEFDQSPTTETVHNGAKFMHVLQGAVVISYADDSVMLKTGDSAYFDARQPHGYHAAGAGPARAIIVTTPPRG